MKPFRRLVLIFATLTALLAARPAHATITVLDYWRAGENDPGAVSGGQCTNTVDAVGGDTLTNMSVGGLYPIYTNGVSLSVSAETGSTLALSLTNGQYGTAAVATSAVDNFGIECWVNPGITTGGHILAYNGVRGNGWGLYLAGTNFEVLYGGEITFGSAPATPGAWTHLALVRNNGVAILYTNGVPASTNSAATPLPPTGSFTVGGDAQYMAEDYTGLIDEVRVFTFTSGAFNTSDLLLNSTNVFVSNTNDAGAGSLRASVANAPNGARITFAANLSGQTILLTNGQIVLSNNLTIDASALMNGIQINGNRANRVFAMGSNETATLTALTITNGSGSNPNYGGGVINYFSSSTLTLNRCTVVGNATTFEGGGLYNIGSTLVNECTFTGNSTGGNGAGGIYNDGTMVISQSTISGNTSTTTSGGSGLTTYFGTLKMTNTIVAGNAAPSSWQFSYGTFTGAYNLTNGNPLLAPLGNYGGPTQTMPPLAGSPAIDAASGDAASQFATDQRGYPRLSGSQADIGAVEAQYAPGNNPPVLKSVVWSSVGAGASGSFQFTFTNAPGADFTVLTSTNLALPLINWTVLGEAVQAAPGQYQFIQSGATNPAQFFSVVSP